MQFRFLAAVGGFSVIRKRSSQQLTGQSAGVLVVAQQHFTVDDRGQDAVRLLLQAARTSRQIVFEVRHLRLYFVGIEYRDVGDIAFAEIAASAQAPERGQVERDLANRLLDRQRLFLPYPVTQQMALEGRVLDL